MSNHNTTFTESDRRFMRQALDLARRGQNRVLPNPLVGAVVVKNGELKGCGYHREFGGDHAEVIALREAGSAAEGATLYVTLEPCSHYGKTPPCTVRIIDAKIARAVVAMQDPNPLVAGRGIEQLQSAGIRVDVGLLGEEAAVMNRPFIKFITRHLPYVYLKIAQSLDGRISDGSGKSQWISGEKARRLVHQWRAECSAVLVGIGTVLADNPRLTVRHVEGPQPLRIVLDSRLRIPLDCVLLSDSHVERTLVLTTDRQQNQRKAEAITRRGARVAFVPALSERLCIDAVMHTLAEMNVASILVEGGCAVYSSFILSRAADAVRVFVAPKLFGEGLPAFAFGCAHAGAPVVFRNAQWRRIGEDMLFEAECVWTE